MPMMIDWITAEFPFYHTRDCEIHNGIITRSNRNGEVVYECRTHYGIKGSYDDNIQVKSRSFNNGSAPGVVYMSGNPVKFFQGHNLWGSDDICGLIADFALSLADHFDVPQPLSLINSIKSGAFTISRIDINGMYDFGSQIDSRQFLNDVQSCARTRAGTALTKGDTVYLNKSSRRWTVKLYNKLEEVSSSRNKKHQKRKLPEDTHEWLTGKTRIELTLKSNELREFSLHQAQEWKKEKVAKIFADYIGRIEMKEQAVRDDIIMLLTPTFRSTYLLWKEGKDLKSEYPKNTFYRHRRELLKHGVDISVPAPAKPKTAKIIPIQRVITCKPAEIPEWAIGTDWFYEPGRSRLKAVK